MIERPGLPSPSLRRRPQEEHSTHRARLLEQAGSEHAFEGCGIAIRKPFEGNLLRQPAYLNAERGVAGPLAVTNEVTKRASWIGCYPGLTDAHLNHYVSDALHEAVTAHERRDAALTVHPVGD